MERGLRQKLFLIIFLHFLFCLILAVCWITAKKLNEESSHDTIINIYKLDKTLPLILKSNNFKGNDRYYWPSNSDGDIIFKEGDVITLACPGNSLIIYTANTKVESAEAVHNSGKFNILEQSVDFAAITCASQPLHTARYTGETCLGSYKEAEIGFKLQNEFIRHIKLCFDDGELNTLYTEFTMTRFINGYQRGVNRPNFIEDNFYNIGSVKTLYTRNTQRQTINALVGLSSNSYKYVSQNDDLFLSKGHLAAKVDFVYESQQHLTFHYINAAPQWQTINGGNWNSLEQDVRTFVAKQENDITIFTGTYGKATLIHESDRRSIELVLYNTHSRKALPVPQLFWKVLYNPNKMSGIAFVSVNNPYLFDRTKDIVCKDICDQISWLHWSPNNMTAGYSYCCDVNDLNATIKIIPEITVNSILR